MQEMVYDDARWIQRLKRMGCWNDAEARRRTESGHVSVQGVSPSTRRQSTIDRSIVNGKGRPAHGTVLLLNGEHVPNPAHARPKSSLKTPAWTRTDLADGFDAITLSSPGGITPAAAEDPEVALSVLKRVKSIRGQARQEYGKVYKALGRFYNDAIVTTSPMDCLIFKIYSLPEHQAQILCQVRQFANSDPSPGSSKRESRLTEMVTMFDAAALLEFRKGYEYKDIQGRMRQYAHVMHLLNGGVNSIDLFLHDNRLITQKASLGTAADCVEYSLGYGQISLERAQSFFDRLANGYRQESAIIDSVFPSPEKVQLLFLQ